MKMNRFFFVNTLLCVIITPMKQKRNLLFIACSFCCPLSCVTFGTNHKDAKPTTTRRRRGRRPETPFSTKRRRLDHSHGVHPTETATAIPLAASSDASFVGTTLDGQRCRITRCRDNYCHGDAFHDAPSANRRTAAQCDDTASCGKGRQWAAVTAVIQ